MSTRLILASSLALVLFGCGPGGGTECTANTTCAATEVCSDGNCVDALSPQYDITLSIDVADKEQNGDSWDGDGSAPDVGATLEPVSSGGISGAPVTEWDSVESFHPTWQAQQGHFSQGSFEVTVTDDDSTFGFDNSETICTVALPADTASFLHAGGGQIDGTSCRVTLSLTPSGS